MSLGTPSSHIMFSIDALDKDPTFAVLDEIHDLVDVIKFSNPPVMAHGVEYMTEIKERYNRPVVADLKVADVPYTSGRITKMCADAGCDAIMIHGFIGSDAILDVKAQAGDDCGVIVVTELTHPGGLEFTRPLADTFAELAAMLDCYGIQAPGNRPQRIAELRDKIDENMVIVSCGIGAQGGDLESAVAAGADFGIVGRGIAAQPSPRAAAEAMEKQGQAGMRLRSSRS